LVTETFYKYPWLNASINHIAKNIAGYGYSLTPSDISTKFQKSKYDSQVKQIDGFLTNAYSKKRWENVKDVVTFTEKIRLTVTYLILFGYAGWEVIKDGRNSPSGFDFINGVVLPHTNEEGDFKDPAFLSYSIKGKNRFNPVP